MLFVSLFTPVLVLLGRLPDPHALALCISHFLFGYGENEKLARIRTVC